MELPTQNHLSMLRDLLTFRLGELRAEVHAAQMAREQAGTPATEVKDRKDDADTARRQLTDDAQEERDRAELRLVEAALARLDGGSYGDCTDCGDPIPLQRLMSQPAAQRCAPCQSAWEQRH